MNNNRYSSLYKRRSVALLLAALAFAGCSSSEDSEPAAARTAMTITTAQVQSETWPRSLEVHGQITAWQEAQISARVSGLPISELRVEVGERVKRGDLLARLDARTVQADLAQARATLAQANANARLADADYKRALALRATGGISAQDVQRLEAQLEAAQAQRDLAAAQVSSQQIRLDDCEVRAVDDGSISARSVTLGQVVQAGTELFRLIRGDRLEWRAELNAEQLAQVRAGQAVSLALPDGSTAAGRVRQIAPALDDTSRLGLAYVDISPGSSARAAMYASGEIVLGESPSLVVPAEAVVLRDGRSSIFLVSAKNTVRQVAVDVARRAGALVEVRGSVQPGDVVAVRGAGFLNDGDSVKRVAAQAGTP